MKLTLLCGGPSLERDISLNSVRSVFDHYRAIKGLQLQVVFIGENMKKYHIDEKFLYSNTTYDFEFSLHSDVEISEEAFQEMLLSSDMVFPVMHGFYGEDGQIQSFLEKLNVHYIGSPSKACQIMYNKKNADELILKANSMPTIPKVYIGTDINCEELIKDFMISHNYTQVVIKPVEGGSSIGVSIVTGIDEAVRCAKKSVSVYGDVVVEQLCEGKEFTVIILEANGKVSALMPTEVELLGQDGKPISAVVFDKRKKYLSTTETHYYCPARFSHDVIANIRSSAEKLFRFVGAHDFLRIDGWLLNDGSIYFSDFNPISGMEQNSFIFQQASAAGLRHKDLLALILQNACARYGIEFHVNDDNISSKKRLNLLLGGITSERQVSLMSGTNVWLKLLNSSKYYPVPYILFQEDSEFSVYEVPYAAALKHTTEEIYSYLHIQDRAYIEYASELKRDIISRLQISEYAKVDTVNPQKMSISEFIDLTKSQCADVFIGLHGGFGENGDLQSLLENAGIHFNGAGSKTARLCMDKYETGQVITSLNLPHILSCRKVKVCKDEVPYLFTNCVKEWANITNALQVAEVIVKPDGDGCSTGIVILSSAEELRKYLSYLMDGWSYIPEGTFSNQPEKVQLPSKVSDLIFEEYVKTADFIVTNDSVGTSGTGDWVELTVGVLEKHNCFHALNPSITVAANAVLSLEEKFQGGTGINITPPPANIISEDFCDIIKASMEKVAAACGIKDYCRIDIFANNKTNTVIVIELNTLPGLSPSTVLFQQGAKEVPPLYPMELLEKIIE